MTNEGSMCSVNERNDEYSMLAIGDCQEIAIGREE
jgi:hypothetical protein